jgi:TonB family protein
METRQLPFSRIRLMRIPGGRSLTPQEYQEHFRIAYAEPSYPADARFRGLEGTVVLNAVIGKDGAIQALSVDAGHPALVESAVETVRHWAYRPLKVNGIPVEVETQIEVSFKL